MMKRKYILFASVIILTVGCSPATVSPMAPTLTLDNPPIATTIPTLIPSQISSPTLLPTNTPDSGFKTSCPKIADGEIPLQDVAAGTVIFDTGFSEPLSLLDLRSGSEYKIPVQTNQAFYFGLEVSPDHNMLAYIEEVKNNDGHFDGMILWIVNARAEVLQKITFNLPGLYNLRWLDNQSMIFYTQQTPKDGTVIFFNPFTREQRYISNDLPNLYENLYNELIPWFVEYSRDMDLVVYLNQSEYGRTGPVLWDVNTHQAIWQHLDVGISTITPLWSPTLKEVAIIDNNRRLYIVDQNGNSRQFPHLETEYSVTSFSWSPNGENIAFWTTYDNFERARLMVYDLQDNQVVDFCIVADEISGTYPIWSPDSQAFFTRMRVKNDDGSFIGVTILVDVVKRMIYSVAEETVPVRWMNSMP